jgi:hypothetical protein
MYFWSIQYSPEDYFACTFGECLFLVSTGYMRRNIYILFRNHQHRKNNVENISGAVDI